MSTDGAAAVGPKTRAAAEKAVEQVFKTREEAQAAVPEGAKRLCVWKVSVPNAGECFVVAGNDSSAINLVATLALKVTAESTRPKKAAGGGVNLKSQLAALVEEAKGCKTKEAQELVSKIQAMQAQLDKARADRAAAKAATPAAPEAPAA